VATAIEQRWSFPRVIENRGLDISGVRAVDQRLEELLTPGATVITYRLRYYSLYPWALHALEEAYGEGGEVRVPIKTYRRHLHRLSLTIALSTKHVAPDLRGAVGNDAFRADPPNPRGAIDLDAMLRDLNVAEALPDYKASLVDCGLVYDDGEKLNLQEAGSELAKVVARLPGMAEFGAVLETGRIKRGWLARHGESWSLSALDRPENGPERALLAQTICGNPIPPDGRPISHNEARSATVAAMLRHADRDTGKDLKSLPAGWDRGLTLEYLDRFEWFHLLVPPERDATLADILKPTAERWRCLQARRVLHAMVEYGLSWAMDHLPEGTSKTVDEWVAAVAGGPIACAPWLKRLGFRRPAAETRVSTWLARLDDVLEDDVGVCLGVAYDETVAVDEASSFLVAAVTLIGWVRRATSDGRSSYYGALAPPYVSLEAWDELEARWQRQDTTLRAAIAHFLEEWVLRQHKHNAIRKFRHDMKSTLRFYEEDGVAWATGLPVKPGMTAGRSHHLFAHLHALGFVDEEGYCTPAGRERMALLLEGREAHNG